MYFDLDGTLADSISESYKAHINFLNQFGAMGGKAEFEELNGLSLSETIAILKKRYYLPDTEEDLTALYRGRLLIAYNNSIQPCEGASDTLEELINRKYNLAIVTSADQEIGMGFIEKQNLGEHFQIFVFGDEVEKAKPNPEIYRLALKKTNASAQNVAVVEDSYNGVKSAKATGAFVIGVANNQSKEDLIEAGADTTILKLSEILQIL